MHNPEGPDIAGAFGRQELGQRGEGLTARAAVGLDERARGRAQAGAAHGIAQQLEQRALELAPRSHLHGGAVVEKRARNLGEVVHVRTKDNWLPEDRRFEDIVATSVDEAAADEDDCRDLEELGKLADGVEDDDVVARFGIDAELGPARDVPSGAAHQPFDIVEALGLPWRDDEERLGHRRANALERLEDVLLFALERAGGDDDRASRADAEIAQHTGRAALMHVADARPAQRTGNAA